MKVEGEEREEEREEVGLPGVRRRGTEGVPGTCTFGGNAGVSGCTGYLSTS